MLDSNLQPHERTVVQRVLNTDLMSDSESFAELQIGCKKRLVLLYMVEIEFLKIA